MSEKIKYTGINAKGEPEPPKRSSNKLCPHGILVEYSFSRTVDKGKVIEIRTARNCPRCDLAG